MRQAQRIEMQDDGTQRLSPALATSSRPLRLEGHPRLTAWQDQSRMEDGIVPPRSWTTGRTAVVHVLSSPAVAGTRAHSVTTLRRITGSICHPIISQSVVDTLVQVHVDDGRVHVKILVCCRIVVDIDHWNSRLAAFAARFDCFSPGKAPNLVELAENL